MQHAVQWGQPHHAINMAHEHWLAQLAIPGAKRQARALESVNRHRARAKFLELFQHTTRLGGIHQQCRNRFSSSPGRPVMALHRALCEFLKTPVELWTAIALPLRVPSMSHEPAGTHHRAWQLCGVGQRAGELTVSNGMNAPTRNRTDVPKWRR